MTSKEKLTIVATSVAPKGIKNSAMHAISSNRIIGIITLICIS